MTSKYVTFYDDFMMILFIFILFYTTLITSVFHCYMYLYTLVIILNNYWCRKQDYWRFKLNKCIKEIKKYPNLTHFQKIFPKIENIWWKFMKLWENFFWKWHFKKIFNVLTFSIMWFVGVSIDIWWACRACHQLHWSTKMMKMRVWKGSFGGSPPYGRRGYFFTRPSNGGTPGAHATFKNGYFWACILTFLWVLICCICW